MNTFSRSTNPKDSIGEVLRAQNALHYIDIAHLVVLKNDVVGRGATAKSIIKEKSTDWVPATSGLRTLLKLVLAATT